MDPAFSSKTQASWFAGMLAGIMSLPLLLGTSAMPGRSEIYNAIPWRFGGHPYFHKVIFEEKQPLDIAFIGSSRIWCGIDPVQVRDALSRKLERPAEVRTLGWNTAGFDSLYFIAEDLLANREVKLLVVNDEYNPEIGGSKPHRLASRWYRHAENSSSLSGLSFRDRWAFYASSVLGAPRNLLGRTRANLSERSNPESEFSPLNLYKTPDPALRLGSLRVDQNYHDKTGRFVPFEPINSASSDDALIFSDSTRSDFGKSGHALPELQLHFAKKLAALAKQHGAAILFLHHPSMDDGNGRQILEAEIWPDVLEGDIHHVGIPPLAFFKDLSEKQIERLFSDPKHLNRNGQDYFTPLVTPSILRVFDEINHP